VRAETCEELNEALDRAMSEPGPHLIDAIVPSVFSGWKLRAMPRALRTLERLPNPVARTVKRRMRL
jgi:acetolactate synthase-1/2/3 large subunit